jgi:hypothetical protein
MQFQYRRALETAYVYPGGRRFIAAIDRLFQTTIDQ